MLDIFETIIDGNSFENTKQESRETKILTCQATGQSSISSSNILSELIFFMTEFWIALVDPVINYADTGVPEVIQRLPTQSQVCF